MKANVDGKRDFAEGRGARASGHGIEGKHDSCDAKAGAMIEGKHDSCGVFGIYSFVKKDVSYRIYNGLVSIQHRGQDSAGIAILNSSGIRTKKGAGLVAELFSEKDLKGMHGQRPCGDGPRAIPDHGRLRRR
ncbi:MAG: hypothetical protein NT157_04865 [Candidatus Micrarchaeota archaeon]|nr:hypothetical protein [Candidatus Micrarchaeota archaeon]